MIHAKPRVLIVEDEPDMLLLLRINLESAGFDTSLAADGATAMRRIDAERPDLVLLDLMLPVMDGWAILAELHTRQGSPPVVVCSAKGGPRDVTRARDLGAVDYVTKPFDVDFLIERMWAVLEVEEAPDRAPGIIPVPELPIEGIEPA